jgi:hypothetical protein
MMDDVDEEDGAQHPSMLSIFYSNIGVILVTMVLMD